MAKIFTTAEICEIIRACGEAGVVELKFHDIHLKLIPQIERKQEKPSPSSLPATEIAEPNHEKLNERALLSEELTVKEDQLADLAITDPFQAEQLRLAGEIDDEPAGKE